VHSTHKRSNSFQAPQPARLSEPVWRKVAGMEPGARREKDDASNGGHGHAIAGPASHDTITIHKSQRLRGRAPLPPPPRSGKRRAGAIGSVGSLLRVWSHSSGRMLRASRMQPPIGRKRTAIYCTVPNPLRPASVLQAPTRRHVALPIPWSSPL
jgi:hypothetical protein